MMGNAALKPSIIDSELVEFKGALLKRLRELAEKNNKPLRHYMIDILAIHCEDQDDLESAESAEKESFGHPTFTIEEIRSLHGLDR